MLKDYAPKVTNVLTWLAIIVGLYLTSLYSYLLFHSLAEIFSIIVGFSLFVIAWHSRKYLENDFLLFIGIAYFFIAGLDLIHTLSYKGMNIFKDYDYYANQLWIAARFMESVMILIGICLLYSNKKINVNLAFLSGFFVTAIIISSIFYWKIFPECFVEGKGLTIFKKVSEYIISLIFLLDILLLFNIRESFERKIFQLIIWSIIFKIISELAFTFYVSNYGLSNLVGHYFKIFSFYLIYIAIIETGISKPYNLIFRELSRKEQDLWDAKVAAEAASRTKGDFLASMSHELRTPLNAIIGFSEVLRDKYFGDLNERQESYIKDILESGKHLLSLINDILDLSKVEAGKTELDFSQVDIKILLKNSLIMIKEKAMRHGISLDLRFHGELSDSDIQADERRLKQVMFNLLSNAAKFTPDGGAIVVEAKQEGEDLIVSVSDTGIGISPENQKKIFDEFYQVSGGITDKTAGTGLGLPLTKSLIEMHGGRIWVESEGEGKGSRFSFVLPLKLRPMEKRQPEGKIDLFADRIVSDRTLLNHLHRTVSLSIRHDKKFILCYLLPGIVNFKEKASAVIDALQKEKRAHDFLGMDRHRGIYLILQETDDHGAKVICDRFVKNLESLFEDQKFLYSIATFPEDGETSEALLEKVREGKSQKGDI